MFYGRFFGEINSDFRAVAIIGSVSDDNLIFNIDLKEYDSKFTFGAFNIKKDILKAKHCHLLKMDERDILNTILLYISYERFEGGYFSKGKFIGKNTKNLKFIGICGDIANEMSIKSINLDEIYSSMPKLTSKNGFYVSKFYQ
ncbi:hypothetical protein [Campylobacter geochelonis]|uniref:Uncharacterized protein n=1 Tax=Campylobacter geochelonis TaxID=1780362 RepID=A0A128EED2_9BACT|nr:hypothetical protein [Campylobacter geochelonis]QKF72172.1 hypothetical protein CGEO_1906 [Campylobacter geochelonis]CZE46583.1 Uncharacterised protein [Campylobacter geochelonis]